MGSVAVAGEQDDYTFTGSTGQRVFFDGLQSSPNITARLFSPSGNTVFTTAVNANFGPLFLPETGTYRLNIDGTGDAVGAYGFQVYDVASMPQPDANGDIVGALDLSLESGLFRIDAAADQTLAIVPSPELFSGTASQLSLAAHSLTANGSFEDGYDGIRVGINHGGFRPGAAINVVLITDEDRDRVNPNVNFNSTLGDLDSLGGLLNSVVNANLRNGTNQVALGVDSQGVAYLADGSGGFTTSAGGRFGSGGNDSTSVKTDYIDLAWALDGAAWDLNQLRAGGLPAQSFAKAFVEVKAARSKINWRWTWSPPIRASVFKT